MKKITILFTAIASLVLAGAFSQKATVDTQSIKNDSTTPALKDRNILNSYSTIKDALNCGRTVDHDREYSVGGKIRVDQAFICISKNGQYAALHYRTSAMDKKSYTGKSESPWLDLTVLDKYGNELYKNKSFDLPDVERCGGYQGHWKAIPLGNNATKVYSFELSMGGTNGNSCQPKIWDKVRYSVQDKLIDWSNGNLTESEIAILKIVQMGGV